MVAKNVEDADGLHAAITIAETVLTHAHLFDKTREEAANDLLLALVAYAAELPGPLPEPLAVDVEAWNAADDDDDDDDDEGEEPKQQ